MNIFCVEPRLTTRLFVPIIIFPLNDTAHIHIPGGIHGDIVGLGFAGAAHQLLPLDSAGVVIFEEEWCSSKSREVGRGGHVC